MTSVEILNSSLVPDSFSWVSLVGDCEVGATRKACKNCTCGRAEAEAKVEKLELTAEQINNPQSACGSVSIASRISVPISSFLWRLHCMSQLSPPGLLILPLVISLNDSCSVGWVTPFDVAPVRTEVSHHSSLARR